MGTSSVPFWERCHFVTWTVLILVMGYLLGAYILRLEAARAPAPITVLREQKTNAAPLVHLREIREGKIIGAVATGAQLRIGEIAIVPDADRTFSLDADAFLVNVVPLDVPASMQFVASRRGKNYYPLSSKSAENLKPENRIYFESAVAAEAAGYNRGR